MDREIIGRTEKKSVTKITTFVSEASGTTVPGELAFATLDISGDVARVYSYDGKSFTFRNDKNNSFIIKDNVDIITGFTITEVTDDILDIEEQRHIAEARLNNPQSNSTVGVLFKTVEVDDYHISINLVQNVSMLDTLSVSNQIVGETPERDNDTGVIIGSLFAVQKIKNAIGEPISIPLRNVPVLIFNPTEEFPIPSSLDDEGRRIKLNLIENSKTDMYFSKQSYDMDKLYLKEDESSKTLPEKYKYSTITNDNGEFILYDVPAGERILLFEVDLLKQGLTPDEVELNFFPYQSSIETNLSNVPHYFFRELPVNVVPSWGTFQTGYTKIDVTIDLNLRKWTTYFIPPISAYERTQEKLREAGFGSSTGVRIRDMARVTLDEKLYPDTDVEVAVIPNILDRSTQQLLMWETELRQVRDVLLYPYDAYMAFKLPANIYDPNGFKTNFLGIPSKHKGVWLSGYQFKIFLLNEVEAFRVTGFERHTPHSTKLIGDIPEHSIFRSHYDLNRNVSSEDVFKKNGVGEFPYERPWSATYPNQYKIPKFPKKRNPDKKYDTDERPENILEPYYLDGDGSGRVKTVQGFSRAETVGGYGLQRNSEQDGFTTWFSQTVANSFVYKYEAGVSWTDEYSNGYIPGIDDNRVTRTSRVVNGEQYQRTESGYSYFLNPQGFPRIWNRKRHDELLPSDIDSKYLSRNGSNRSAIPNKNIIKGETPFFPTYVKALTNFEERTILPRIDVDGRVEGFPEPRIINKSAISIYRIADPDPKKLALTEPPRTAKFAKVYFQGMYVQRKKTSTRRLEVEIFDQGAGNRGTNRANNARRWETVSRDKREQLLLNIKNNGTVDAYIFNTRIRPGKSIAFTDRDVDGFDKLTLNLPGNFNFQIDDNSYESAKYSFWWSGFVRNDNGKNILSDVMKEPIEVPVTIKPDDTEEEEFITGRVDEEPKYYFITKLDTVRTRGKKRKGHDCEHKRTRRREDVEIQGAVFESSKNTKFRKFAIRVDNVLRSCPDRDGDLPYGLVV